MTKESEYKEVLDIATKHNKLQDFHIILEDYFIELEKYHPQTYTNLMRELHKLGAKINIDDKNELSKYIKHIHHKDIPQLSFKSSYKLLAVLLSLVITATDLYLFFK